MMKNFFYQKDAKTPRWTPYWVGVLLALAFATFFLGGEIGLAFRRFFRAGIWMILGIAVGGWYLYNRVKAYENEQDMKGFSMHHFFVGLLIVFGGVLGPLVGFKAERASGIPDEAGLYYNGKVINCCNPDSSNYYFDIYLTNPTDSLYIVTYGEEPGYGLHPFAEPSNAPRRMEASWRHVTKHAARLKGKY